MLVSIVIPNYNGSKYIKTCLDSIYSTNPTGAWHLSKFEIIVVDNGSTDDSCSIISENYPSVNLIDLPKNYGFSKAVNEGIKSSKGRYVILLNNDTKVKADWLSNLVSCIESDDRIFSCSSKMVRYFDRNLIDDAGDNYNALGWAYKRGDGFLVDKYNKNCSIFSSCGGAAIYRREIFDKIGYFDESFFAYFEDTDISYRAKINGYKNVYCSSAVVYHMASATSGSRYNKFKAKLVGRNNIYVIYKNMPFLQLLINSPVIICGIFIKVIFYFLNGLGNEYISGIKDAFDNIKSGKIKKVKYRNKNLISYVKIEFEMIVNTFEYFIMGVFKLPI